MARDDDVDKRNNVDFLLEIGTEEMPSAAVDLGIDEIKTNTETLLKDNRLNFSAVTAYGTPRRLTAIVSDLSEGQEDSIIEIKGPSVKAAFDPEGKPTQAALGFARSQGVEVDDLTVKDFGGEYVVAVKKLEGKPTEDILRGLAPEIIGSIQFPKMMRWGSGRLRFIRPVRWITAVYGEKLIDFDVDGLRSDTVTYGHRFLAPKRIRIDNASAYRERIESGQVLIDQNERKKIIIDQINVVAKSVSGRADINKKVLGEVVNLVEYPQALIGSFSKGFLDTPKAVVKTAMESHQRYFPVEKDGQLLPYFIVVQNGSDKYAEHITRGHERVIQARLADAAFFFKEDSKTALEQKTERLKSVTFQQTLGSVYDKVLRIQIISGWMADRLNLSEKDKKMLSRAAYLCKSDLVTGMVGEFPELQGSIGKEYALVDGEPPPVAEAIAEHYLPRFAGDALPSTVLGAVLAIADKADSVAGSFSVGLVPSGSQDPYALRRQAQGCVAVMAAKDINLSIDELLEKSLEVYKSKGIEISEENKRALKNFWEVRLRKFFTKNGFAADEIEAIISVGHKKLGEIGVRLAFINKIRSEPEFEDAKIAFTRCINLSSPDIGESADPKRFVAPEESLLWEAVSHLGSEIEKKGETGDFDGLLKLMASMRPIIDRFFDAVLVMDKDEMIKENRLKILNRCSTLAFVLADFSKLS